VTDEAKLNAVPAFGLNNCLPSGLLLPGYR
jgi:hypothetical protein